MIFAYFSALESERVSNISAEAIRCQLCLSISQSHDTCHPTLWCFWDFISRGESYINVLIYIYIYMILLMVYFPTGHVCELGGGVGGLN